MAEGLLLGGAVGAVVAQAYNALYNVAKEAVFKMVWCKKYCKALAEDLGTHLPIFREICRHMPMPAREWEQRLLDFKEQLEQGRSLVEACIQLSGWHPIQRLRYSKAILKLRQQILQHLQNLAPFNTLLLQQLYAHQHVLSEQQDDLREAVNPLIAAIDENATLILEWVRQANSTGADYHEGQTSTVQAQQAGRRLDELQVGQFLIGLDDQVNKLKSLLFSAEDHKMVTIVGGMGGIGKTTLALAICKDPQVREFFQDRIHFFTVSQSPDMMGLLSTIWQQVVGGTMPLFQNEEDAHRQLKGRLLSILPSNRLLVLDDVWSKANLDNLSFEAKRCRILITTRQASILETHNSHIYTLELLSEENAQSLFCYWAFGQDSIPEWAEEDLAKEVISECKCLPLALKVIGGSLSSAVRFPIAWQNARDKLRQAEPLGEYHKDALQRRLQTSIDALDPKLQECFLDLGAFPEDSSSSVDTLLDIWMYVRGMEWVDAILALAELSSRCLLDLDKKPGWQDDRALENGSAWALVFSQHDVMRDVALYLGRKNQPPSQRRRLLMPQKGKNIPKNWESVDAPLAAQIISINTGAMMEQDWPSTLAFPFAEALLLYNDGGAYQLPPFVQSMDKLKVMFISSSRLLQNVEVSLAGLSHLQSIEMVSDNALITLNTSMPKLERLRLNAPEAGGVLSMLESQNLASLSAISLFNNHLSELPENCCQLRSLQLLYIVQCMRFCKLPKELGKLTNLVWLRLRRCHALKELPASLCELQHLKVLEMRGCINVKELPQNLGQLGALKELSLSGCRLRNLPESFGNLSSLKRLDLLYCSQLRHLPRTFGQLVALKKLDLEYCAGLQDLPDNFGLLRSLGDLSLSDCMELKQLPENFGLLSNLKRLNMCGCSELKYLPNSFVQLSSLKVLLLTACSKLEMLPESFGQLSCLKELSLEICSKLDALPESFGELSCLEYLNLHDCERVKQLPVSFGKLRQLKQLILTGAAELEALPENFGQLSCLEVLDLGGCKKLKHLPESFGQLSELRRWEMHEVGLESLPASVRPGLVALERVKCSESLVPLWKSVRGDTPPHPQIESSI